MDYLSFASLGNGGLAGIRQGQGFWLQKDPTTANPTIGLRRIISK